MSDEQPLPAAPVPPCDGCIEAAKGRGVVRGIWLLVALARPEPGSLSEREQRELDAARRFLHATFDLERTL